MGGHPYWYVVDYEEPEAALQRLRAREFAAGRYNPVLAFPLEDPAAAPGPAHPSIDAARRRSGPDGTRSILDIVRIASVPDYCVAAPLTDDELDAVFGTRTPSAESLASGVRSAVLDLAPRGMARYVVLYDDTRPSRIFFAGYSFD